MKSIQRFLLAAVLVLSTLGASCPEDGTTGSPTPRNALTGATTATGPTKVKINFYGTISHLLGGTAMKRAVLLRDNHRALMEVSGSDIKESDLTTVFGARVTCTKKIPRCLVEIDDVSLRFASGGTTIAQPTVITTDGSFDELVPQLTKVTGNKMKGVKAAAWQAATSANTLISASVDLPAGEFSATAYNSTAEFDHDHQNAGERGFGREIILTSTIDSPSLEVSINGGAWQTLPVQDSKGLELRIVNAPQSCTTCQHFDMHYDLADPPLKVKDKSERPEITNINKHYPPAPGAALGPLLGNHHAAPSAAPSIELFVEVPGCSNSQWP